jgi:hypothetical protein
MPDTSPHCKRLAAELSRVFSDRFAAKDGGAKASDAPKALVKIEVGSRPRRRRYANACYAQS